MRVNSLISSARSTARVWLASLVTMGAAGVAQASGVYWSVDVDVPIERHGRIGTVVSNTPGGVHRGGYPVVVTPAPVIVHQPAPRYVHAPRQVVYVPVAAPRHGHWRHHRGWHKKHHRHDHDHGYHHSRHDHGDHWRGDRDDWRDDRGGRHHRH